MGFEQIGNKYRIALKTLFGHLQYHKKLKTSLKMYQGISAIFNYVRSFIMLQI